METVGLHSLVVSRDLGGGPMVPKTWRLLFLGLFLGPWIPPLNHALGLACDRVLYPYVPFLSHVEQFAGLNSQEVDESRVFGWKTEKST